MITLRNVTLRRGPRVLLEQIDWTIYHKQRIGIIGANGSGKSSLFAVLLNEHHADLGEVDIPAHLRLSHVAQETRADEKSAIDFILDADVELRKIEAALTIAENENDGFKIGALHEKLSIIDGYSAPSRAAQLLDGLGFSSAQQTQSVSSFSGGWRVRLNLAKALMCPSDVLLLDEPTNHLDLDAVIWLEQWLLKYPGTLLLISHDRDFLDHTTDHIAYFTQKQIKVYTGNYSSFEKQHAEKILLQQASYEKQQKQIAHLQSFINRFKAKASKAKQAQSRVKAIERMDLICAVQTESAFHFEFKKPLSSPNPLIKLENVDIGYGSHIVLKNINFSISPKERIAILGPNGAGKSSFIKVLANSLAPLKGERHIASGLKIGYFAQHQVDQLNLNESPLEHLREISNEPELILRKFLGTFNFTGDRVLEPIANFSGGEKSRLALALIVWQRPNLLLLDEPTNHLDLDMRQALSIALQEYEGAMILITHDRFLVRTTTDQLYLIAHQKINDFDGDLQQYQEWLISFRKQQAKNEAPITVQHDHTIDNNALSRKQQRKQSAEQRKSIQPLLNQISKIENHLAQLQKKLQAIEHDLTQAHLYEPAQKDQLKTHLLNQAALRKECEESELKWLTLCEQRDNLLNDEH